MAVDADQNVVVTFETISPTTNRPGFDTIKYDGATGVPIWESRYDGPGAGSVPGVLMLDADGNVIVAGTTATGDPLKPYVDVYVVKYAAEDGTKIWANDVNIFDEDGNEHSIFAQAAALDSHGDIVLTGFASHGSSPSDGNATQQFLVMKCSGTDGSLVWSQYFLSAGGGNSEGRAIAVDSNDDIAVGGMVGTKNSDTTYTSYYVAKYRSDGMPDWRYTFLIGEANAIATDGNANVIVTGTSNDVAYTAKFQPDGTPIWHATTGLSANALALDTGGNVAISGVSTSSTIDTALLAAADGSVKWEHKTTQVGTGYDVRFDASGNVAVLGQYSSPSSGGNIYFARYSSADGTPVFEQQFGDSTDSLQFVDPLGLTPDGGAVFLALSTSGSGSTAVSRYALINCALLPYASAVTGSGTINGGGTETLSGTVTPSGTATTAWFVYGPSAGVYNQATAAQTLNGTDPVGILAVLTGLNPHAVYHFRIVTEESGILSYGADSVFTLSPPAAVDDVLEVRNGGLSYTIDVLANDTGPFDDPLTIKSFPTAPSHGDVSTDGAVVTYTPGSDFTGTDSFTYLIQDSFNLTSTATVTINVTNPATVCVALQGSQVLGEASGTIYASFGAPSINDAGLVAFQGTERTLAGVTKSGVFAGAPPAAIAVTGATAPGLAGSGWQFTTFKDPVLNPQGDVAFIATAKTGKTSRAGIWSNVSGSLALVAGQGIAAPGTTGRVFGNFLTLAMPESGAVAFSATLLNGAGAAAGSGIWLQPQGGTPKLVAQTGDSVLVDGRNRKISTLALFASLAGSPGQRRGYDSAGDLLIKAGFSDGTQALLLGNPNSSPKLVADASPAMTVNGVGAAKLSHFDLGCVADDASACFLATLVGGGVAAANNRAIVSGPAGGGFNTIARTGGSIPGITGATYQTLQDPVANRAGAIAFLGTIHPATKPVTPFAPGLWTAPNAGTAPSLLVKAGDPAPGVTDGTFAGFSSIVIGARGPAFIGTLTRSVGGVTIQSNTGLWAVDSHGVLRLLVRSGTAVSASGVTRTPQSFTIFSALPTTPSQGQGYSDNGGFVYRATFADHTQGIFSTWVP